MITNEELRCPVYFVQENQPTVPSTVTSLTPLEVLNLNWKESDLPERERTKHVHRLHPYLGKFVPQLVEVFLRKYFVKGQTVLDPFCGSGTTLVQANELSINSVGYDISAFNVLLSNAKTSSYNINKMEEEVKDILYKVHIATQVTSEQTNLEGNQFTELELSDTDDEYLKTWFAPKALKELLTYRYFIETENYIYRDLLKVILTRSARSARLTTHFDLDFPVKPQKEPYYCHKHSRQCYPTTEAYKFIRRYSLDTIKRIKEFDKLRTEAKVSIHDEDSRRAIIPKIDGVITSPPYVGLIDYHEQHAYAYHLLGLNDKRESEIGAAANGSSKRSQEAYQKDMALVLRNVAKSMSSEGRMIIIANDSKNLYEKIIELANLKCEAIINRHVNRRTGRRSSEFYESIFILKKEKGEQEMNNQDGMKEAIQKVIKELMDDVMNKVLITDPFVGEEHHSKKPLYAALVPDEIFKGSHFERRFVTPFGNVWEKLAVVAANYGLGFGEKGHRIDGFVRQGRLHRIQEVLNKLEHSGKGEEKVKPDWEGELKYILEGKGELIPTTVISDVYAEDKKNGKRYAFELKAPLPNSDQTKVSKEKILKLYCMEPLQIDGAYYALPYNPYKTRENYSWSFPQRWFNMQKDEVVLIGNDFWDKIGGVGTYNAFINAVNELGIGYKDRIYREYLGIEPPKDYDSLKL